MKKPIFAWPAIAMLFLGCQTEPPAFTDVERAAVAAEIEAARDAYFDAATNFETDALFSFLDEDFFHMSNASIAPITEEMLREAWRPLSHIEMERTSDRVVALTRDSGYTMSTASYVVFDTAGVVVESNDWAGTHIWIRRADGWKVQAVHEGRPIQ
jgi:hypothetical protein